MTYIDLDNILLEGEKCHEFAIERRYKYLEAFGQLTDVDEYRFLCADDLVTVNPLKFNEEDFMIESESTFINEAYFGKRNINGTHIKSATIKEFHFALQLVFPKYSNCIITIEVYTYAILYEKNGSKIIYHLFDSHPLDDTSTLFSFENIENVSKFLGTKSNPNDMFDICQINVIKKWNSVKNEKNENKTSVCQTIVNGSFAQNNEKFMTKETINTQCTTMSTFAILYNHIKAISDWEDTDLNYILLLGDSHHKTVLHEMHPNKDLLKINNAEKYLNMDHFLRKMPIKFGEKWFYIEDKSHEVDVVYINSKFENAGRKCVTEQLYFVFEFIFENRKYSNCVFTVDNMTFAVIREMIYNREIFYLFDSHANNDEQSSLHRFDKHGIINFMNDQFKGHYYEICPHKIHEITDLETVETISLPQPNNDIIQIEKPDGINFECPLQIDGIIDLVANKNDILNKEHLAGIDPKCILQIDEIIDSVENYDNIQNEELKDPRKELSSGIVEDNDIISVLKGSFSHSSQPPMSKSTFGTQSLTMSTYAIIQLMIKIPSTIYNINNHGSEINEAVEKTFSEENFSINVKITLAFNPLFKKYSN